jgi:hypothetical protein
MLRRLEWTVIRRLDGLLQGDYRTLMRGGGVDLADLREYQHHDDVRHIDWNVTARLQQPYVRAVHRRPRPDRLVPAGPVPQRGLRLGDHQAGRVHRLCGHAGAVLTRHGNRVGAMLYGTQVDTVHPRAQRAPPCAAPAAPHAAAARLFRQPAARGCTSFCNPGQHHQAPLNRVRGVGLHQLELEMPDLGLITLRDAESGEQVLVDTHDAGFRRRFSRIAAQREADLRQALVMAGVDTLELSTDGDLVDAVMRFTELRKRRSQLSGGGLPAHISSTRKAA